MQKTKHVLAIIAMALGGAILAYMIVDQYCAYSSIWRLIAPAGGAIAGFWLIYTGRLARVFRKVA